MTLNVFSLTITKGLNVKCIWKRQSRLTIDAKLETEIDLFQAYPYALNIQHW